MKSVTASALRDSLKSSPPPLLIHVLPEEAFAAGRIADSLNACVYETAFVGRVRELVPDLDQPVVVYGDGDPSLDSAAAATKLEAAGYTRVLDFRGGLREWIAAGFPVERSAPPPAPPQPLGRYAADTETSVIRWTGRNLFNHHHGTLKLKEGEIAIGPKGLESARFVIDMNRIACEDLADPNWNAMLIRHLRDEDFFAVDRFPTATFTASRVSVIPGATEGTPGHTLEGELTLRGVTRPLSVPIVVAAADAEHLTGQCQFEIDRTEFGSLYGSGKWFSFLGKHVVNDHIHLHVKIHAARA